MRKKKGNLLQRKMALLLSVVLAAGMALDALPLTALALENAGRGYNAAEEGVSENAVTEEETGADSAVEDSGDGDTEEAGESKKPAENPVAEEQDGEPEQKQPAAENEESISGNDLQPDKAAVQRKVMQAELVASGTGWTLDADGTLTIESDAGMADWCSLREDKFYIHPHEAKVITVEIADGVTTIGQNAFMRCTNMPGITLPQSVTSIGKSAFQSSGLTSIVIPENVVSWEKNVFLNCTDLKSVRIPSGITSIEESVFCGCPSLETLEIPENVTEIGRDAFQGCSSLHDITIPGKVTSIGEGAFYKCSGLENIIIPASVTSIGEEAFYKCSGLENIIIPASVTSIGRGAFDSCSNLTDITFSEGIAITRIEEGLFVGCTALETIAFPLSVTSIGGAAFGDCSSLSSIEIPDGVTSIERETFYGCSSLTEITIPSGVTDIGYCAFYGCSSLTEITVPSGVTDIDSGAFYGCSSLTEITIPSGVTDIGYYAFYGCSSLGSVIMQGSKPPTLVVLDEETGETQIFNGCKFVTEGTQGIKVPAGTVDAYKAAWTEWKDYVTEAAVTVTPADKVAAAKAAVEDALADIVVSNDTTEESLAEAVTEAVKTALEETGIDSTEVTVTVEDFAKTEATKDAVGSITATVKITSGTETAEVAVDQTIAKLPAAPADKVAAAKKAVEEAVKAAIAEALAGTEVTNDNAEEIAAQIEALLPDAVAEALTASGVSADEVGIGDVDITVDPASAVGEGSITVTIPVISTEDPEQTGNAVIRVPVTVSGGEEDPDKDAEEAKQAVEEALKNITITNEMTPEEILAALKEALGDDVTVDGMEELDKVSATQDAPGRLTLQIKLVINGKTIYVTVDATIPRLEKKTGVYVRFTDYYDLDGSMPLYRYTGLAVKPAIEVYHNETLLTSGKDYTVAYKNNVKAGSTAALTVKGKGSFTGTSNVVNYRVVNADIDKDTDHPTEMTVIVNTKVTPVIMNGTKKLTTKDYQLEGEGLANGKYAAATEPGVPNILTVKGKGNYEGSSFTVKVTVVKKKEAGKFAVKVDKNYKPVYNGSTIDLSALFRKPQDVAGADTGTNPQEAAGAITVTDTKDKTKLLEEGKDFSVICTSDLTNAGTVKFTVTGMGAYTGSVSKTFKISPRKITDNEKFSVTFDEEKAYEYKVSGVTVDNLMVKYLGETESADDDTVLVEGRDYKVTYSNHKKVSGTKDASLKVTFLGNYKGSKAVSRTFKVVTAKLSDANTVVTVPDKVYGKAKQAYRSTPIVTVDGVTIKSSSYTVSYAWATASEAADDTKYVNDNKVKITIADGDAWAKVKVTITPKQTGSYGLAEGAVLTGAYYVRRKDDAVNLTKAKVTFFNKEGTQLRSLEYNGSTFYTPAGNNAEADHAPDGPNAVYVRVVVSGAVVDPSLYDVTWTNATAKGKATVVIRGRGEATAKGMAVGSKNQTITIKAMTLKGKTLKSYVESIANAMNSLKELFFNRQ